MTSRWVDHGGVRIHFLDSDPTGTSSAPLVFVPGLTDVATDYFPVLDQFGRRTVVIDLRGRGLSDAPAEGYGLADHAGDIEAVIGEVTDGAVHLATFSRGTCYALAWLSDNVDRVLSLAIGDYPGREIIFPEGFQDRFMAATWRGTPVEDRLSRTALDGITRDAIGRPFWAELGALTVPVVVVRAGVEGPLTDEDWALYASEVPKATLLTFEESPHDIFRPDRTRYPRLVADHAAAAEAG